MSDVVFTEEDLKRIESLSKAEKLAIAGVVAPVKRSQKAHDRVVTLESGRKISGAKMLEKLCERIGVELEPKDGIRPTRVVCERCGRVVGTNKIGVVSVVCGLCKRPPCGSCGKTVSAKAASLAFEEQREPRCKECSYRIRRETVPSVCKRGHSMAGYNIERSGKLTWCRTCKRDRARAAEAKKAPGARAAYLREWRRRQKERAA